MSKLSGTLLAVILILLCGHAALAGTQEDLDFARGCFSRKWYDWATEVAEDLIDSSHTSQNVRGWAAELHVAVLTQLARETGDEKYRQKAEALTKKYQQMFPDHDAWGAAAVFALLQRRLESAQDLARRAEIEPNEQTRAQLTADAVKIFEEVGSRWENIIKKFREELAAYPAEHKWGQWAKDKTDREQDQLLDRVWHRNLAEYLYATSFIFYAKVVSKEKKAQIVQKGLKKFMRFIDGDQEHEKDYDPAPAGEEAPWGPDPRDTFRMLIYLAEIGIGQCYVELGQYDEAIEHFDYMVQAPVPDGTEGPVRQTDPAGKEEELKRREADVKRIVDIRLQAYYLEGYAYNLAKKPKDAERILKELLDQSGKEVQPDRPNVKRFWEYFKRPEVAVMPNVREKFYGKLASLELAKALTAQGRYSEGIDEVYKIFVIEQAARKGGQVSPFEVNAAKTMAELSKQVSTVKFPIGAAYAVARGFHYQEQWADAILAYKRVYGAPGTPSEVREYAPKALFELGKLLYTNERYLEAAIALSEICEQFQDFQQITQAANLMKQSFRKVKEAAGASKRLSKTEEDWLTYAKKLYKNAVPASLEPIKDMIRQAQQYANNRNFRLAAETYENIPKTYKETGTGGEDLIKPNPYYAIARAQLGYCSYILYEKRARTDPKDALNMLIETVKILEEALNEAAAAENKGAEMTARFYLAKSLVEDLWKDKDAKDKAKKALEYLAPFKDKFKDDKKAQKYIAGVWATTAFANYKLQRYDKMHIAFQELEKNYKVSAAGQQVLDNASFKLYGLMKKQGDNMAAASAELAVPYYEQAAYYVYAWYKVRGTRLKPEEYLWVGQALSDTGASDKSAEVLAKYFGALPAPEKRSEKQKEQATHAKILLAQARYGMGHYEAAAGLFNLLRRVVHCKRCGYEETLKAEDFNKLLGPCPKCKKEGVNLEKKYDTNLTIQEGAAKSYLAMYEKGKEKDMVALNKAQDIYQRIYNRLRKSPSLTPELRAKYYEVLYTIVKIWFYKRDFGRIVGDIRTMIMLSGGDADNPTEEDWKKEFPVQPWRGKIVELFEKSLKASKGK